MKRLPTRDGAILVAVMVCLLIVTGLAASMVKPALQARKTVRLDRQRVQTQFLLEAGIQRAVQQLAADAQYTGETWRLSQEELPDYESGVVEIKVTPADGQSSSSVEVIAQIPADSPQSVRRSHTFTISNEE